MEAALLLGELGDDRSLAVLSELAMNTALPSEFRSAAVWGMAGNSFPIVSPALLGAVIDPAEDVALHAIVSLSRMIVEETVGALIDQLADDDRLSAAICKAIELSRIRPVGQIVSELVRSSGNRRAWLAYLLAVFGRDVCEDEVAANVPAILDQLDFFWTRHGENWTNRLEIADRLQFLAMQDRPER